MIHTQTCYIKFLQAKLKENQKKRARRKQLIAYEANSVRLKPGFSSETIEARRQWDDIKC